MRNRIILGILSLSSFSIAANIYTDLRGFDWGLFKWVDILLPLDLSLLSSIDSSFILYNLPDVLWMVSFILLLAMIWLGKSRHQLFIWMVIILVSGLVMEASQYFGWIRGTFDILDMVSYVVVFILFSYLLFIKKSFLWKT
jgi:hypothetical protein